MTPTDPCRIRLVEHETAVEELPETVARSLAASSGSALSVAPADEAGQWQLKAGSYVGTLVLPGVEVLIRPKIRPENVFLLLEVGLPPSAWGEDSFAYATDRDLLPSVVAFFARTAESTLARGVLRSYRERREPLVALRGRIDLAETFRRPGLATPIPCRFDEHTGDIWENRLLKSALRRVLRVPGVDPLARRAVLRNLARLEDVADVVVADPTVDDIVFTRLNRHYEPALRLAELILRNLTLVDRAGGTQACSFLVDMNHLYQRFLAARLRRLLAGRLEVVEEPTRHLAHGRRVQMNPDLVFADGGVPVYVGDAKYKLTSGDARTSDYYQLLAYTTALDLDEGVLIYCLEDGDEPHHTVTVRHAGKRLAMYRVNLRGSPDEVEVSLTGLAEWITQRAAGPTSRAVS